MQLLRPDRPALWQINVLLHSDIDKCTSVEVTGTRCLSPLVNTAMPQLSHN